MDTCRHTCKAHIRQFRRNSGKSVPEYIYSKWTQIRHICKAVSQKFWKVSTLVHLLYKHTYKAHM